MPQYADPSVLMQGKGIDLPGPMDLAKGGMSLQALFQGNQIQQMSIDQQKAMIDALQNPEVMQQIMGGGMLSSDQAQQYGPAVPKLAEMSLGFAEKRAKIGKDTAEAGKFNRDTLDKALEKLGNFAGSAPATPQTLMSIVWQLNQLGIPPQAFGTVPSPAASTADAMMQYMQNVGTLSTSPEQRSQIIERNTMLPTKLEEMQAGTAQKRAETTAIPQRVSLEAYGKTTERYKPEMKENPLTGNLLAVSPWQAAYGGEGAGVAPAQNNTGANGPGGANAPSVRPPISETSTATGDQGSAVGSNVNAPQTPGIRDTGVQTQPRPMQKEAYQSAGKELDDLTTRATTAGTMKAMILDLRNQEANQGLYSGGIAGTDFFRRVAGVLAPALSPEQQRILASTQAWDAQSKALVAEAVRQFAGARVAARELPFFEATKPNELQTAKGRELVYRMLFNVSDRIQQAKLQADQWSQDPTHTGLSGWTPSFKSTSMPPIMVTAPNGRDYPAGSVDDAARMKAEFEQGPR